MIELELSDIDNLDRALARPPSDRIAVADRGRRLVVSRSPDATASQLDTDAARRTSSFSPQQREHHQHGLVDIVISQDAS